MTPLLSLHFPWLKRLPIPCRKYAVLVTITLTAMAHLQAGTEYFVRSGGSDFANGLSRETAFATIQKGVDALSPGDTLTILPGEYPETVKRENLGSPAAETTIRADIPGTVLLRGDTPAGPFRKTSGYRFVFETDFNQPVFSVSEADTLTNLKMRPTLTELDVLPGGWYHDAEKHKLYVSATNFDPATDHHYRASIKDADGLYLKNPQRVIIEGLAFTGYNHYLETPGQPHYRTPSSGSRTIWGLLLFEGKNCIVRNCTAYLNGGGIAVNNGQRRETRGYKNLIQNCVAYGNGSQMGGYESSGIGVYLPDGDEIRECLAYNNYAMGIRTYGQLVTPAMLRDNLAWGNLINENAADIHIKDGLGPNQELTSVENSVALSGLKAIEVENSVIPSRAANGINDPSSNVFIGNAPNDDEDWNTEFADIINFDLRLQKASPQPEQTKPATTPGLRHSGTLYFVSASGNDTATGTSLTQAFKTVARGLKALQPGDTLYLEPGTYQENLTIENRGKPEAPIFIRGRGIDPVKIQGSFTVKNAANLKVSHLQMNGPVRLSQTEAITLEHCQFLDPKVSLKLRNARGTRILQGLFTGFEKAAIEIADPSGIVDLHLSGNIFNNTEGIAIAAPAGFVPRYSDYNAYSRFARAWEIDEKPAQWSEWSLTHDQHSRELKAEVLTTDGYARLQNPGPFLASGPLGKPLGPYRDQRRQQNPGLLEEPKIHSVSATTANIEWTTSAPMECRIAWGETPECLNTANFEVNYFGSYSLTGLKPGQTYYFKILSLKTPSVFSEEMDIVTIPLELKPLQFQTAVQNAPPRSYYVATDGNDENSGLTREQALRHISTAAAKVNAGDTILIGAGTYPEKVIIRATGDTDAPITIKSLPGEKVILTGANKKLSNGILATGKSHLRIDGLYFSDYSFAPGQGWFVALAGDISLYRCKDIQITRCFSDGRGGYTARAVNAFEVDNLLIKNCVSTNKMSGAFMLVRCPNFRLENSVIARPMIASFILGNLPSQEALVRNNIFTDCLEKKSRINTDLFNFSKQTRHENNAYFLRDPASRTFVKDKKLEDLTTFIQTPFVGDPQFAGVRHLAGKPGLKFAPDVMMAPDFPLDFNSFFAANPEVIDRKIGLEPEAFADFVFTTQPTQ